MRVVLMAAGVIVVLILALILLAILGLVVISGSIADLYMPDELERDYI